jgi:uncharacterized membrane protein
MMYLVLDVTLIRLILAYRRRKKSISFYEEITEYLIHIWISGILFKILQMLMQ